ncbi:uncharacterized protein LOC107416535 isoform X2 [Ziziphus jujuba]|uniref:Uncharacterized protein LOC107416535 isoform X2 n=2 Tax=Ziziphus jujuba TaxID=326968 RepID=A0A6P3ZY02_ZIZJJ|nr:uncharacterized protein LOC107416535 isoform X2 [Ziziphus jujuba]KAH7532899.1 hypothetical protein FEM48_Zijuj04G0071400 [Ziziphus jujuba var. spinosa]
MGRKLDALLGRDSKTKIKALAKLAISRVAILKNQRQVRCSHARSDVKELLQLGHQQRALLRVEHVIKEQNMFDVFVMIDYYCNLLLERVKLIQKHKDCADELKETTSSLIFAASRCGELPELQEIRGIFTSVFGKELVARAVESRNNCGVNPKMIQRLSTRQPSLESRLKVLKEIAFESDITLQLEEDTPTTAKENEKLDVAKNQKKKDQTPVTSSNFNEPELDNETSNLPENIKQQDKFSESMKGKKKYQDVAAAAQEAFISAAHAAAAARAAVELSTSNSQDRDDQNGSDHQGGTISEFDNSGKAQIQMDTFKASMETDHWGSKLGFDKIHLDPIDNLSRSEGEDMINNNYKTHLQKVAENKIKQEIDKKLYALSLGLNNPTNISRERKIVSHNEPSNNSKMVFKGNVDGLSDVDIIRLPYQSPRWISQKSQADSN